jgi:hypothetical protein
LTINKEERLFYTHNAIYFGKFYYFNIFYNGIIVLILYTKDRHFWLILAHLALFFYGMALFIVGGDFFGMKIIRETTEIKVFFSNLIELSMKFGSL